MTTHRDSIPTGDHEETILETLGRALRGAGRSVGVLALFAASCGAPSGPTPADDGAVIETTTVTILPGGVNPSRILVKPGSQVTFVNNDTRSHNVSSNPHPEHGDCPAINDVGVLSPGQARRTGNLNLPGTCGYHDHDDSEDNRWKGTIAIQ